MILRLFILCLGLLTASAAETVPNLQQQDATNKIPTLLQPSQSPLVTFRIVFNTGAAYDPAGQEGIAALTAAILAEGGTQRVPYAQILERMYPMATSLSWQVDKEMTVFHGTTHAANLTRYYNLVRDMILLPGFRDEDFQRLKADAINYLRVVLRESNDEELGKERLYNLIYKGHPYQHHSVGTVSSLQKITIEQVKSFYRSNYIRGNLLIGLAGGYPPEFPDQVRKDFLLLPTNGENEREFTFPETPEGLRIELVQRDTRSTAISLGFPITVNRAHKDYPALALVASWFGQHRSSNSYLYQRLREARGLNYGDYAYIEYFPRGMFQFHPDPNLARQQQIFQIWIRPVPPEQSLFTLRAALYEYDKLVRDGLSRESFEATREFLLKFVDVMLQTQTAELGYALDSDFYGIPPYREYMKEALEKLTLREVNAAIRRHLKSDFMRVVMVTKDAEKLKADILAGKPSPITYNSPKPEEILEEDKIIQEYPIPTQPEWVTVTPVGQVFQ